MKEEIVAAGGRIDNIYVCTEMESENRKPNPGMGLQAIKDFPTISLAKSVMIGNTISDMKFGRNLGVALNIFLTTTQREIVLPNENIDLIFDDLITGAKALVVS
jgi:histidinol phosphatase-like enzyme